ncbi:hypothetical protein [Nocardia thailandica]
MNGDLVDSGDTADLVVLEDEIGTTLVGPEDAIAAFVRDWETEPVLDVFEPVTDTTAVATSVFGGRPIKTAYALGTRAFDLLADGTSKAGNQPKGQVTYHRMVRVSGKIVSNARVAAPAVTPVAPAVLAVIALEATVRGMFEQIADQLEAIEDKVDEILRLASAERIGDVYGHHRLLARRVQALAAGDALTATDWSSVAALGADLEVGVERLRAHAIKQLETLDPAASPGKRADQLDAMLTKNRLGETLRLLVVAQKSLFLWQQLRLEQVRIAEPEHLEQTVAGARSTVHEQYCADLELVRRLREVVDSHAVLRTFEAHHKFAARTMTKRRQELAVLLSEFAKARNLQLTDWVGGEHASLSDAFALVRTRTGALVTSGRKQLAAWIEPEPEKPTAEKPLIDPDQLSASGADSTGPTTS